MGTDLMTLEEVDFFRDARVHKFDTLSKTSYNPSWE
jgi:hypothetical protein